MVLALVVELSVSQLHHEPRIMSVADVAAGIHEPFEAICSLC